MASEQMVREIAESLLEDDSHFLVEIRMSPGRKGGGKVLVLLDGDAGVSIDDCAKLSRALGAAIEEKDLFEEAYTLEVSTPGVDYPLGSVRQYRKNIGRTLRVHLEDGSDLKGVLQAVSENSITLLAKTGKGKKAKEEEVDIPHSRINKSIVQISFK